MNLKEMLNAVLEESSYLSRDTFVNSPNVDDRQMVAIANRVVREIRDYYDWSALLDTFTIDPSSTPTGKDGRWALPDDYDSIVADSAWETDGSRKVDLPVPRGRWFMYKFSTLTDAGRMRCRLYDKEIEIHEPSENLPFSLEYRSLHSVTDESLPSGRKELFTSDNDGYVLDDSLIILGTQGWWARNKMMPQAETWMADYKSKLQEAVGRDNSGQTIGGSPTVDRRAPYYPLYRRTF